MVNFTVDEIRRMMSYPNNVRCLSVIAHVDHGKSTLTDSLIGAAGIIAEKASGDTRFMDTRKDEQERTITIKSTGVSLYFELNRDEFVKRQREIKFLEHRKLQKAAGRKTKKKKKAKKSTTEGKAPGADGKAAEDAEHKARDVIKSYEPPAGKYIKTDRKTGEKRVPFLINLIDSPGHVDFSSEVTAALRVTDGALVVVDCIEGVCVQTETVLRQAIAERIRPVLWVNKLDRIFLELHMDLEEAFLSFQRAVESVNVTIATYRDELLGDVQVNPQEGNVGFGSGLMGWGFTTETFARMYYKKYGISKLEMMHKLWGQSFVSAKTGKFFKNQYNKKGIRRERVFCSLVLKPIQVLGEAVTQNKTEVYQKILSDIGVKIPKDARNLEGKQLLKRIMQAWLPAADALLGMIANFLPSPVVAQKYRVVNLYRGPLDDACARAIRECDPNGPVMMYVSKMIPTHEKGRFYAFGRVFSGTIATGQQVRIQGSDYIPGEKKDLFVKKIQRTVLMMGRYVEQLPDVPCGNTCGLVGVDQYILKTGTITTDDKAHNFADMKYSVSPVVKVAVECKNASDLPKLMEGLKRLSKSDPLVQTYTARTGEHIIAGCGELHLQICLKDLEEDYMKGAPITRGNPVVSFCETVSKETDMDCIGKSANKHNRIYLRAEPLGNTFLKGMDDGFIAPQMDYKKRARFIVDEVKWDMASARKIWAFGVDAGEQNVIVDMTKGIQYMNEIKDSVVSAFEQASCEGVLCGEAMKGIRFNVVDVVLHADSIHRGAGQIMPPTRRACYSSQIRSAPRLLEPMYIVDITVPNTAVSGVYSTLNMRRGEIDTETPRPGTPLVQIKAYLPVLESFGFTGLLRERTSGQAFPQMIFSHWKMMNGDVYQMDNTLKKLVPVERSPTVEQIIKVRKRKGMRQTLPMFSDYYDKV